MSLHPSSPAPRTTRSSGPPCRLVEEADGVRIVLAVPPVSSGGDALDVTHVVDEAVHAARARRSHHVITAVEVAGPFCGPLLQAARARVGVDVRQVRTRRAGSSVLVDLELLP